MKTSLIVGLVVGGLAGLGTILNHATSGIVGIGTVVDVSLNMAIWVGLSLLVGWLISLFRGKKKYPVATDGLTRPTFDDGPGETLVPEGPGWYQDPFGRFALRYWDGKWTDDVSTHGRTYKDSAN